MKKWRIGSFTLGLFLVFLGVTLFAEQFNHGLAAMLMRNWWPALVILLGLEVLLTNVLLHRQDGKFTYDLLSVVFVAIIGFISLGVYSLQSIGLWDRLTGVVAGETEVVEQTVDIPVSGKAEKVILDVGFYPGTVRVWDSPDGKLTVRLNGFAGYHNDGRDPRQALTSMVFAQQIGGSVHLRLRTNQGNAPWMTRPDVTTVLIPSGMKLQVPQGFRNLEEFHGTVVQEDF